MYTDIQVFNPNPTDKICIIVYGNIASGKSLFVDALLPYLPEYRHVSMDKVRLEWHERYPEMNPVTRERSCEDQCIELLTNNQWVIYETTAASIYYKRARRSLLGNHNLIYVHIDCPTHECAKRYEERKDIHIRSLIPFRNNKPIRNVLNEIEQKHGEVKADLTIDSYRLQPGEMVDVFRTAFGK